MESVFRYMRNSTFYTQLMISHGDFLHDIRVFFSIDYQHSKGDHKLKDMSACRLLYIQSHLSYHKLIAVINAVRNIRVVW